MFKERLGNFICWVKESSMITIMITMWASTIINNNEMVLICCTEKEKENHEDMGSRWESCHLLKTNYFYYLWLSIILVMMSVWGCHVRQNVSGKMTVFSCESSLLKIKCLCFSFISSPRWSSRFQHLTESSCPSSTAAGEARTTQRSFWNPKSFLSSWTLV